MFKEIVKVIKRIVSYKILLGYFGVIAAILLWPLPQLDDYLSLNDITDKKALLFTLLTTTIGFSGFVLTVLIVSFNIYVKSVRRSTLEFVTDNKWLKVIYSCIVGNSLFLSTGYIAVNLQVAYNLTFIYIGLLLTLTLMLGLFPIAIISLNDTLSLSKTKKLLGKIERVHISQLYGTGGDKTEITEIEKNPILILKDMAIAGINDRDWVVPQTIIKSLYELLITSLDTDTLQHVDENIHAWALVSNHLKRDIVKNHDSITGKALLECNLQAHFHLVDRKLYEAKFTHLDNFILDFVELILETNNFVEIHPYLPRNLIEVINHHINNIEQTDIEIPTPAYHFKNKRVNTDLSVLRMYWHYVNTSLPDLIFRILRSSIDLNKKSVYDHYTWHVDSLLLSVLGDENKLTEYQQEDLFDHLLLQAESLARYALSKGLYEGIEPLSEISIVEVFKRNKNLGYRAFFSYVHVVKGLSKKNALSGRYISELFQIARVMIHDKVDVEILNNVTESVIENTILLISSEHIDKETVNNLKYQLNSFKTYYLLKQDKLEPLRSKYVLEIEEHLKDYDPNGNTYFL